LGKKTKGNDLRIKLFASAVFVLMISGCGVHSGDFDGFRGHYGTAGESTVVTEEDTGESTSLFVHVCGEVKEPGLYRFVKGSRAGDAVEMAGGFTKEADRNAVNLAALLTDGQQICIPARSKNDSPESLSDAGDDPGRININTADATALTSLKGIGESKAAAIIEYREEHGHFASTSDICNVPGIGKSTYDRIKDSITI